MDRSVIGIAVLALVAVFVANALFNHTDFGWSVRSTGRWYVLLYYVPFGVVLPSLVIAWLKDGDSAAAVRSPVSRADLVGIPVAAVAAGALAAFPLAPFTTDPEGWQRVHRLFALLLIASFAEVMIFLGLVGNSIIVVLHRLGFGAASSTLASITASCLLFGLFHFTYPSPWNDLGTALLLSALWIGVSIVFYLTRSLLGAVIFNNALALVGFVRRDLELPGSALEGWARAALAILLAAAFVWRMRTSAAHEARSGPREGLHDMMLAEGASHMGEVKATGIIAASVDKVWSIVRDFGNMEWGGITGTTLEGEGVGAVRTFSAQGVTIRERLETLDDLGHVLSYSILEPAPIPWTGHLARIALSPERGATRVEWSGRFEPRGLSEEQVATIVRGIFENGIRQLQRAAE